MILHESKNVCDMFHCYKKGKYNHKATVTENMWFEKYHISPATCILITYCFAVNMTYEQIICENSINNQQISRETVTNRISYCREVCMFAFNTEFQEEKLTNQTK